jgi:hypothetical protein
MPKIRISSVLHIDIFLLDKWLLPCKNRLIRIPFNDGFLQSHESFVTFSVSDINAHIEQSQKGVGTIFGARSFSSGSPAHALRQTEIIRSVSMTKHGEMDSGDVGDCIR